MSAERNLSPNEYELLSAYLDGELTPAEQQSLEERLSNDPLLQRELNTLRTTVSLINLLPEMPAPRDFTLTADMITPANIVPLRPRRAPRSAYLSLVASVVLMVFGALFMVSDISTEPNVMRPAMSDSEVALLPTDTAIPDSVEQQAERTVSDMAETLEDDTLTDVTTADGESSGFLTAEVAEEPVTEEESDALFEIEESEAEDDALTEPPQAMQANDAVTADDMDADLADEPPSAFGGETTDETLMFESAPAEESADEMADDSEAVVGASVSAPEVMSQLMLAEVTEDALADDGVVDLDTANIEADPTDALETPSPVPPPAETSDTIPFDGQDIGIGLLVGGVLLLIVSLVLFRRNRS